MESQTALDEFERRLVEMAKGVKDLLKKNEPKIAILLIQQVELEKIKADQVARLSRVCYFFGRAMHLLHESRTAIENLQDIKEAMGSHTALDELDERDESERRALEMMQGMEYSIKKQDRKIAVLLGQKVNMERVNADKVARLSRLHLMNPSLHLMNPILHLMNDKLQEMQDELEKINGEASDMALEEEQKCSDESQTKLSESQHAKLEARRQELEEMKLYVQKRESTVDELCFAFQKLLQENKNLYARLNQN